MALSEASAASACACLSAISSAKASEGFAAARMPAAAAPKTNERRGIWVVLCSMRAYHLCYESMNVLNQSCVTRPIIRLKYGRFRVP